MLFLHAIVETLNANQLLDAFHSFPLKESASVSTGSAARAAPALAAAAQPPKRDSTVAPPTDAKPAETLASHQIPIARFTQEGKQIPRGNGGIGPNYTWTQTLTEATVRCWQCDMDGAMTL